jgi:hypothetical protein
MSCLDPRTAGDHVAFDRRQCEEQGTERHDAYVNAHPFPHAVIDDFLPAALLRRVVAEFPQRRTGRFDDPQSRLKTGYQLEMIASPFITNLLHALNSAPFLVFLEKLTGVAGLIPDPWFEGGGLHETARGGHLSIHADFNIHRQLGLIRRLNLILFLNEGWQEAWGGALELWDRGMQRAEVKALPVSGRAVVFNTDADSYHGHPDPLACPDTVFRRSIALYYYTSPRDGLAQVREHTTQFKVRPGSADRRAYGTLVRESLRDLCPPALFRLLTRTKR